MWVWPEPGANGGRENLTPSEWDEITDALVTNFRTLRSSSDPLRLALSGGKDSRLCLALAKAAGLQGPHVTITNGPVDSPEVLCAAAVAEAAGFRHKRGGPAVTIAEVLAARHRSIPMPSGAGSDSTPIASKRSCARGTG